MAAAAAAKLPGPGRQSGSGARGVSGSRRAGRPGGCRCRRRRAADRGSGRSGGDGGDAVGPACARPRPRSAAAAGPSSAERRPRPTAERGGEQRRAAGGVGAGLGPEPVGERDARGAVGGGVEGFERRRRSARTGAPWKLGAERRRGGRRRRGWRWSRSRAGGRRSARRAWWQARQTRRSAGSGRRAAAVADHLLELEARRRPRRS